MTSRRRSSPSPSTTPRSSRRSSSAAQTRSGRGRGLFDAILGPHTEADVAAGLEAAEAWLIASMPVGTTV
jgi:hypothetical protein